MVALRSRIEVSGVEREQLVAELVKIENRLEDGYRKINEATDSGREARRWETRWLELLDEYERIYDLLVA